jgi:hypothetical protein
MGPHPTSDGPRVHCAAGNNVMRIQLWQNHLTAV